MRFLILLLAILFVSSAWGANEEHYSGDKECDLCHKFIKKNFAYLQSSHGKIFTYSPRNELEAKGCEACHGPGAKHSAVAGEEENPESMFIDSLIAKKEDGETINGRCLACHQGGESMHWTGSMHDMNEVACTSCHVVHTKQRKVEPQICESCHSDIRAKLQRSSHKPLREGQMTCMDCHNPHGSATESSLKRPSVIETCYECHAERRGPFIWEHIPVAESCATCHDPHGSSQHAMLKMRLPYLCQSCHQAQFHPSELYEGSGVAAGSKKVEMVGKSCLSCHSKIHGSNHPGGANFQR